MSSSVISYKPRDYIQYEIMTLKNEYFYSFAVTTVRSYIAGDYQINGPSEHTKNGKADANKIVLSRAKRLTHQHHKDSTCNT